MRLMLIDVSCLHQAMEVYERMIREDERTAPELVISGQYPSLDIQALKFKSLTYPRHSRHHHHLSTAIHHPLRPIFQHIPSGVKPSDGAQHAHHLRGGIRGSRRGGTARRGPARRVELGRTERRGVEDFGEADGSG